MVMEHSFGEEEARRQQEVRAQREREHRAQLRAELRRKTAGATHKFLNFLFCAAVAGLILTNLPKIHSVATTTASRTVTHVQAKAEASPLRQSAENYEKELDGIVSR
ncbi:MAG: hypothetical protein RL616_1639 [Verrucomicrobiota bacterium]